MLRAASSTSPQLTPAATTCTAASWASSTAWYTLPLSGFRRAQKDGSSHIRTVTLEDYTEVEGQKPRASAAAPPWRARGAVPNVAPEATIVSNDMPSAPISLALCSSSAATSISAIPAAESRNVLEELASHERRLRHHAPVHLRPSPCAGSRRTASAVGARKLRRSWLGKLALPARQVGNRRRAASNPAIATPGCAASHCTAATAGGPATICTCAAFTSSAACAV